MNNYIQQINLNQIIDMKIEHNMLKKIKTNVMSVLMVANKICTECNRFFNEHSTDELLECVTIIAKDLKKDLYDHGERIDKILDKE